MDINFGGIGKKHSLAGLQRICSAQETVARILPIKHKFGITRVANVTGLDSIGLPVVIAVRPNARSIAVSQGKGVTLEQAKASAIMEAVEIWHAEHFDKLVYFASIADLSERHIFVNFDRIPELPGRTINQTERFHWVGAFELISEREILVPLEMVHADYTHPLPPDTGYFPASTNGLASGNHMLEAVCHGICEVIERDSLAVWHHASIDHQRASRLALETVDDVLALGTLQKFWDVGLDCAVWDVTSDTEIPSFLCVVYERDASGGHFGLGSGSHPNRAIALLRSLTEAAQTRLNYITGAREDLTFAEYSLAGRASKTDAFAELLTDHPHTRQFAQIPTYVNDDLKSDLETLKVQLLHAGVSEIAVVDLTREEIAIPVVRVIIPGLEAPHDDDSYIAGPRAQSAACEGLST